MKKIQLLLLYLLLFKGLVYSQTATVSNKAMSSAILNFGSGTCGNKTAVSFGLIGNPVTVPYLMTSCAVNPPFSDVFSKFIAYNPKDNKVYINDIKSGRSKLYVYDMGLPNTFACPASMPLLPTFSYLYVPNNFEFDINGDLWSIRDLNGNNAVIERIDEATGTVLFNKTLNFPTQAPNTLGSGDIVLTPNGRMFIVMGDNPGKLFEITNYNSAVGNATANYIQSMPRPCYGILYMNGTLQMTGTDFNARCYRYVYNLGTRTMGTEQTFQMGQTPVDNSSISPSTGIVKRLVGSTDVDSVTSDLVYEIYAKNAGNVRLANFNITDDLGAVFGADNVSSVTTNIVTGGNPSNLSLNPLYNGVTNIKILTDNQVLTNIQSGYINLRISLRVTNLKNNTTYINTAKCSGEIGLLGNRIQVTDSSNNGTPDAIDLNSDGDPGNENVPTVFFRGKILPVKFIEMKAVRANNSLHNIKWTIAAPTQPVVKFEVEYSEDHYKWQLAGTVKGEASKNDYYLNYNNYSNNTVYYRVKAYEESGKNYNSTEAVIKKLQDEQGVKITPNPADDIITVFSPETNISDSRRVQIVDVTGKKVFDQPFTKQKLEIRTSQWPNGYYVVNVINRASVISNQLLISHK